MRAEQQPLDRVRRSRLLRGLRWGAAATATMTGAFRLFELVDWLGQLPPRQVVDQITPDRVEDQTVNVLTSSPGLRR